METVPKYIDDEDSLKDEVLNYLLSKPNGAETYEIFNFFRNRNNYQFPDNWYSFKFKEKTRRISQEEELLLTLSNPLLSFFDIANSLFFNNNRPDKADRRGCQTA